MKTHTFVWNENPKMKKVNVKNMNILSEKLTKQTQ